tara:strand:- start:784 stop:1401 length:618 start_codon:yes stop_codon:yes gene_type:complete
MEHYDEQQAADFAWSFLRSNSTASLKFDDNMHDVDYIITYDGRLVISVMVAMLQPCDTVMFVPEYVNDCMEMHVSLTQFTEVGIGGYWADRWQVYHGEPPDVQWAYVEIDAVRFHETFIDGEAVPQAHAFSDDENALCKILNLHLDQVKCICTEVTGVKVAAPFVVGVDALGVDIRAPFGIVRIPCKQPFKSSECVYAYFGISNT